MAVVIPDKALVNLLQGALQHNGPIKLHLFSDTINPTPTITLNAFTECHFSGYSAVTLNPTVSPSSTEDGLVTTQQMDVLFAHDGGVGSDSIQGWYMTFEGSGTTTLGPFQVDEEAPIPMVTIGDAYDVRITVLGVQE